MRVTSPLLALLIGWLALVLPATAAVPDKVPFDDPFDRPAGGERILHFLSEIEVGRDGTLTITETIRVRAEGNQIRRGIYRDFPTRYRDKEGRRVRVGFDVERVSRNGRDEAWTTESIDNGVRVRIGDPDVLLAQGEHVYAIRYRTTRQLAFFDEYDELYWNVTGNDWVFPIDRAEARLTLPSPSRFGNRAFYTGPQGSTQRDARIVYERPGEMMVRNTVPLGPYEGLTIAVAWPKGVVQAPPPPSAAGRWLEHFGAAAAALIGLVSLAAFYYHAWRRAGRGPPPGTVVPIFSPPDGLSAAALRYLRRMGYDNRTFAAALVESGVKGHVRLVEEDGGLFSRDTMRIDRTGDAATLPPPERSMLGQLFSGRDSIEMKKSNHASFRAAQQALQEKLAEAYRERLFLTNKGWAFTGLGLLVTGMLLAGTVALATDPYAWPSTWLLPAGGVGMMMLALGAGASSRFARKDGSVGLAILAVLLGLGGIVSLVLAFPLVAESGGLLPMLAPLLALPLVISAFWWMAAPTAEGRKVMDRIAGFQRYLSITEEDRLETLHPPEKTPELFERYLPHAIALGVENRWAARFASVLAAASTAPDRDRHMSWYSGSRSPWSNPGRFATAMGASLASSVAAASTAPGSRSGSGGGGSSGGGGGGGGGGGW